MSKDISILKSEREKLLQRIQRIKNRKGKEEFGIRLCKNCGKEYNEKENFNWSCRTHKYEFSGEMWWCCGKTGESTPGCNFSKHEMKNDEDDEEVVEFEDKKTSFLKCNCCKEVGHKT